MTPEERVRLFARGTEIDDSTLALVLDTVRAKVRAYCRREDIPEALELIVDELTARVLEGIAAGGGEAKMVRMGDTSIELASSAADKWLTSYSALLQSWRKI